MRSCVKSAWKTRSTPCFCLVAIWRAVTSALCLWWNVQCAEAISVERYELTCSDVFVLRRGRVTQCCLRTDVSLYCVAKLEGLDKTISLLLVKWFLLVYCVYLFISCKVVTYRIACAQMSPYACAVEGHRFRRLKEVCCLPLCDCSVLWRL